MENRKYLKDLGWKLYKNNNIEKIYEKHNRETLLILKKDGKSISFKNVHCLDREEINAVFIEMTELLVRTYI